MGLGLAILVLIFVVTLNTFLNPESIDQFSKLVPDEPSDRDIVVAVWQFVSILIYVVAALLLWVMASVGSRISKQGIKLIRSYKKKEEERAARPRQPPKEQERRAGRSREAPPEDRTTLDRRSQRSPRDRE